MTRAPRFPSGMRLVNLLCGGWTAVVFVFLYLPIALLIVYSFNKSRLLTQWTGFTFDWYRRLAESDSLIQAMKNSLIIATATTVLSVALGTVGAWLLYRYRYPAVRALSTLVFIPMVIPEIIMGVSLMVLFAVVAGPLNDLLIRLDLPNSVFAWSGRGIAGIVALGLGASVASLLSVFADRRFESRAAGLAVAWVPGLFAAAMLYRWLGPFLAEGFISINDDGFGYGLSTIIISHVTFCFPFVLVAVQARLSGVDPFLEEAAMDLGATPLQAFWRVIVPYLLPAIISGALMSFTLSMDEVIVTYFVRSPASETLPVKIFGLAKKGLDPSLNAISAVFVLATAVLVVVSEMIRKLNR
jgi:ABC-type spermidine/putrescine transport system permease subunit II